jgi:hypothetical protein
MGKKMIPTFIRVYRPGEDIEMLLNVNNIWKIEVQYGIPSGIPNTLIDVGAEEGSKMADARRRYEIYCGSEVVKLFADPNDPVMQIFDEIYKNAIKA